MLNEWSDRMPEPPREPFIMSRQFWAGVWTAILGVTLVVVVAAYLSSS